MVSLISIVWLAGGVMNRNDKSKGAWYIVSHFNIFLFLSGEEAGTLVFCRKFHVEIQASAGNKTY